jgi:hypothetical protein
MNGDLSFEREVSTPHRRDARERFGLPYKFLVFHTYNPLSYQAAGGDDVMRTLRTTLAAGLCLAAVFACSRMPAPAGRWEGTYESRDTMVVTRLEIDSKGDIYLSAPDATDIGNASEADRAAIRQRLADGLSVAWGDAQPRHYDFDGHVFRKPGGVAPQLELNPDQKLMTAVIYLGLRPAIRIPLHSVPAFGNNPWTE